MPDQFQKIQAVFLIDTCVADLEEEHIVTTRSKGISLSVLRVLNHLSSKLQNGSAASSRSTGIKWGYKLYSSSQHRKIVCPQILREFRLRYFEEMEKELQQKMGFNYAHLSDRRRKKESRSKNHHRSLSSSVPSDYLKEALTEVLCDFQWESPELLSPVKKKGKASRLGESAGLNFVFLFAIAPVTEQSQRDFAGKKVLDDDVCLDSFMPPSLVANYRTHKISLNWIDTSCLYKHQKKRQIDTMSLRTLQAACQKAGGQLMHIENVVRLWRPASADAEKTQDCDATDGKSHRLMPASLLPSSTLLDACLHAGRPAGHQPVPCTLIILPKDHSDPESAGSGSLHLALLLTPFLRGRQRRQAALGVQAQGSPPSGSHSGQLPSSCFGGGGDLRGGELVACGRLDRHQVWGACLLPACLYSTSSSTEDKDGSWNALVSELFCSSQVLVLRVQREGRPESLLALLEAVGPAAACLSLLTLAATLQVEKWQLESRQEQSGDSRVASQSRGPSVHGEAPKGESGQAGCYNAETLTPWHLPGCSRTLAPLLHRLQARLDGADVWSKSEKKLLTRLQGMYRNEDRPVDALQRRASLPVTRTSSASEKRWSLGTEESSFDEFPGSVRSSLSSSSLQHSGGAGLSRSSRILQRSLMLTEERKRSQKVLDDALLAEPRPGSATSSSVKQSALPPPPLPHLQQADPQGKVEDLCLYLSQVYAEALRSGDNVEACVQTLISVAVHHMQQRQHPHPQKSAAEFLEKEGFVLSCSALRQKYLLAEEEAKKSKANEYQLQILLHLEMEVLQCDLDPSHNQKAANEIVNMLRTLSFMMEPKFLPCFLNKTIVTSYVDTLPQLLVTVFEELMQPLPRCLRQFLSAQLSPSQPFATDSDSEGSQASSQPPSTTSQPPSAASQPPSAASESLQDTGQPSRSRSTRLRHHPSLCDFGIKKQIMVEARAPTQKPNQTKSLKDSASRKAKKAKKDVVKVKRNLFEDGRKSTLARRQSLAVMQSGSFHSPRKPPRGSHRRLVAETPARKQVSSLLRNQQAKRRRRRSQTVGGVSVVQESPVKSPSALERRFSFNQTQPTETFGVQKQNFYSGPQNHSRNLTKYLQLADRIAGHRPRPQGTQSQSQLPDPHRATKAQLLSPRRLTSSFLLSQLVLSPSPTRHLLSTPVKQLPLAPTFGSPSQNTRSKTPRKASKMLLFTSPVKERPGDVPSTPKKSGMPRQTSSVMEGNVESLENATGRNSPQRIPILSDGSTGLTPTFLVQRAMLTPDKMVVSSLEAHQTETLRDTTNTKHVAASRKISLIKRTSLGFSPKSDSPERDTTFVSPSKTPRKSVRKSDSSTVVPQVLRSEELSVLGISPLEGPARTPVKSRSQNSSCCSPLRSPPKEKFKKVSAWILSSPSPTQPLKQPSTPDRTAGGIAIPRKSPRTSSSTSEGVLEDRNGADSSGISPFRAHVVIHSRLGTLEEKNSTKKMCGQVETPHLSNDGSCEVMYLSSESVTPDKCGKASTSPSFDKWPRRKPRHHVDQFVSSKGSQSESLPESREGQHLDRASDKRLRRSRSRHAEFPDTSLELDADIVASPHKPRKRLASFSSGEIPGRRHQKGKKHKATHTVSSSHPGESSPSIHGHAFLCQKSEMLEDEDLHLVEQVTLSSIFSASKKPLGKCKLEERIASAELCSGDTVPGIYSQGHVPPLASVSGSELQEICSPDNEPVSPVLWSSPSKTPELTVKAKPQSPVLWPDSSQEVGITLKEMPPSPVSSHPKRQGSWMHQRQSDVSKASRSGDEDLSPQRNSGWGSSSPSHSPGGRSSRKKFSPVSSHSLMHLMQSPILTRRNTSRSRKKDRRGSFT